MHEKVHLAFAMLFLEKNSIIPLNKAIKRALCELLFNHLFIP